MNDRIVAILLLVGTSIFTNIVSAIYSLRAQRAMEQKDHEKDEIIDLRERVVKLETWRDMVSY